MMLPEIFPILANDSDVIGYVSNRIYRHGAAPQKVTAPYITWFVVVGTPENNIDSLPPIDRYSVQIDCWSDQSGATTIEAIAKAVRDAMEPHAHMTSIPINERDYETQRYRIGMAFDYWRHRDN